MRLIIGFLATILLTSCIELFGERGNGEREKRTFTVEDFEKIEVGGEFIVKLTQEDSHEIVIEADENLFEFLRVEVRGNTLKIDTDRRLNSRDGIILNIPVKELTAISCSGACELSSTNPIQTPKLDVDLSGAGKFELQVDAGDISINASGAAMLYLEGAAQTLEIDMSGAGSLEASELEVRDCYAQISGVGKVLVNVTGTLEAEVSGLGQVEYIGEPESVKGNVSGVGNIDRK